MKISNSLNSIYQNQQVAKNTPAEVNAKNTSAENPRDIINKVNIPKDFKLKPSLNRDEQKFFEGMYPKAKRDIGRYLQNQQTAPINKGAHIDIRG